MGGGVEALVWVCGHAQARGAVDWQSLPAHAAKKVVLGAKGYMIMCLQAACAGLPTALLPTLLAQQRLQAVP
jgi:hypothetical protein